MTNLDLAVHFFFQIALILLACRVVGIVAAKLGQPQVVAEMITGVLLGPSLFGLMFPEWQHEIFPWDKKTRDSQSYLYPASQLGLALYMFIVGLEFRVDVIRKNFSSSVAVSLAGMIAPFVLEAGLAYWMFYNSKLFPEETSLSQAMMFLGASMCITAFPMLARIIHFKGLHGTLMGTVAIGAGAIDDAMAWCLLAVVLSSFGNDPSQAIWSIGGGIGFVAAAILVLRPVLNYAKRWLIGADGKLTEAGLVVGLACMALGAWFTDKIQLHAVFGAFIVGAMVPRGAMQRDLVDRIQPLTVALLLPLFFTYSGLNTQINLLDSAYLWGICGMVLVAAIGGKGIACWLAARASGITNREALGIGVLMNARGLMELIIINIGREKKIISEELFTTLAVMAVITTLMASPIFDYLVRSPTPEQPAEAAGHSIGA